MLKAWSITTTVRNPERLRNFLVAIKPLEKQTWNNFNQQNYQKLLIKNRLYGFGNRQFYNGLTPNIIELVNNTDSEIGDNIVNEIIKLKKYKDFAMRGRQSINPLTKFGFVIIDDGVIKITELGKKLIASEKDVGDVFLKSFIKWQIPNLASNDFAHNGDYDIVPFVATLKLISEVNKIEFERGNNAIGISKREFSFFVPSLLKYAEIGVYAKEITKLRDLQKGKTRQERKEIRDVYRRQFAVAFLGVDNQIKINKLLKNLQDYGDNAIRYFRLTKFIRIRGDGFYIDLEPNRHTEIEALFESEFYKPKHFVNKDEYIKYMADDSLPILPWQTKRKLSKIADDVYVEVIELQKQLEITVNNKKDISVMSEDDLTYYINDLREIRRGLQEKSNHIKSQPVSSITEYIHHLENIFNFENRALMLEYLATMGLHALNDSKEIKPNYPVGDDSVPSSTAPGGVADIECFYESFNMICEVTMLRGRDQWFNEGQPVMRHLRDFESMHSNAYCIFIAPTIHTDSAETFHIANTIGYKGSKQKIAPLTIKQFIELLKTLKKMRETDKRFTHDNLKILVDRIAESANSIGNSDEWISSTQNIINSWSASLIK
jgi:hypothetical protein